MTKAPEIEVIGWSDGKVWFLDQTLLPREERIVKASEPSVVADAIRSLSVRGAPLIGITAAYGVALEFHRTPVASLEEIPARFAAVEQMFATTRPTAVNLFYALRRMKDAALGFREAPSRLAGALLDEARRIHREDQETCERIAHHGVALLPPGVVVLTHCNTGSLATGGRGTALGIIRLAWEQGILRHVYVDETRPQLQGARLTSWELARGGIPSTLITDSTAAFLMQQKRIQAVIVGADRIAANGDVANKIGTYALAVAAHHHGIPFYVAAPESTVDPATRSGKEIPIEVRDADRLRRSEGGILQAPEGTETYAPAFDITPHDLITAIVTEQGVRRFQAHDEHHPARRAEMSA